MISASINQLLRYTFVGLSLNVFGYIFYLLVTTMGVSPLMTVTIFYALSAFAGYFAHRRHTFQSDASGLGGGVFVRYILVYVGGYLINAGLLEILFHQLGFPHQLVQIIAIFVVAGYLFLMLKFVVFRRRGEGVASS